MAVGPVHHYVGAVIGRSLDAGVASSITYDVEATLVSDRRDTRHSSAVVVRGMKPSNRPYPDDMYIAASAPVGSPCRVTRVGETFYLTLDADEVWATTDCTELFQ